MRTAAFRASRAGCVAVALVAAAWCRSARAQTPPAAAASPVQAAGTALASGQAEQSSVGGWLQAAPDFDKMRTTDSPAFVILGVSPTEIQRPGTPMGVATSLSGLVTSGSSLSIPTNLALEVAPYWLYGHPDLTAKEYEEGGLRNAYRTFTISVGTKQTSRRTIDLAGTTTDHTDSDLAIGLRSRLYGSGPDRGAECVKQVTALKAAASELAAAGGIVSAADVQKLEDQHGRGTPEFLAAFQQLQQDQIAQQKSLLDALETARKGLDRKCFDVTASAQGLSLDAAGAVDWTFPDSIASHGNGTLVAGAGWLTGAYASPALTVALLARYAGQRIIAADWQQALDGGLRLIYKKSDFAIAGEGIGRAHLAGPGGSTYKVDVVTQYRVTGDSWVSVTFGRSFESVRPGVLFSLANLTWGFGKPTVP